MANTKQKGLLKQVKIKINWFKITIPLKGLDINIKQALPKSHDYHSFYIHRELHVLV